MDLKLDLPTIGMIIGGLSPILILGAVIASNEMSKPSNLGCGKMTNKGKRGKKDNPETEWAELSRFDERRMSKYLALRKKAVSAVQSLADFGEEKLDKGEDLGVFAFDSERDKNTQSKINALVPVYAELVGSGIDEAGVMARSILDDVNAHTESRALRDQFGFKPSLVKTGPKMEKPGLFIAE